MGNTAGMTEPQDPFAAPEPGSAPVAPPTYGAPAQPPYGAPAYGEPVPYGGAPAQGARNGLGITSLVLGIASLLCLALLIVPAVLAIVFGAIGRGRAKRGEATNGGVALAGIITGTIALVIGLAFWGFFAANISSINRFNDCNQAAAGNSSAEQDCSDRLVHDLFGVTPKH